MTTPPIGVLVMAYGTPGSPEEVEPYYTRIRHGHPPTKELLDDLLRRYDAIGGISPLAERTAAQVEGIRAGLEAAAPGRYLVAFGSKYTDPYLEDAAQALAGEVSAVIGIVLTPHQATLGSGQYHERVRATLATMEVPYRAIDHWYDEDGFDQLMARRLNTALAAVPSSCPSVEVLFTAHSLPEKILELGDPYPDQVADSGTRIAAAAGLEHFDVAWQSAGRTRDPWIGPSILEVLPELAEGGTTAVVVCPVGFVADHLEVLYDLDIEATALAEQLGVRLSRTTSLNDDPEFLSVLVRAIQRAAQDLEQD